MQILLVYITTPSIEEARELARTLTEERLAACANIFCGVESFYHWAGAMQNTAECACLLKTTATNFPALERRARELHSYDLPCIVALPLAGGSEAFLRWVETECRDGDKKTKG